jgi:hypothetical protein
MVGFPQYFHVNAGHPVLQHPLYLKYNVLSLDEIGALENFKGFKELATEINRIMRTNDNMPIIWYLTNLLEAGKLAGYYSA